MEHAPSSVPGDSCSECALCLIASAYEPSAPHPAHARPAAGRSLALGPKLDFFGQRALFLRFTASEYRQASFLDDRILTPAAQGMWARFQDVTAALAGAAPARPLHFIFHAGHVGSTLVSRLLENAPGVLAFASRSRCVRWRRRRILLVRRNRSSVPSNSPRYSQQKSSCGGRGYAGRADREGKSTPPDWARCCCRSSQRRGPFTSTFLPSLIWRRYCRARTRRSTFEGSPANACGG